MGFVDLEDSVVEESTLGGFTLEIVTRERRHFFRANDSEDMQACIPHSTLFFHSRISSN